MCTPEMTETIEAFKTPSVSNLSKSHTSHPVDTDLTVTMSYSIVDETTVRLENISMAFQQQLTDYAVSIQSKITEQLSNAIADAVKSIPASLQPYKENHARSVLYITGLFFFCYRFNFLVIQK